MLSFFLYGSQQIIELTMNRQAAAPPTGQIENAMGHIRRVRGKAACAMMICSFAKISRTALHDDMALNDNEVFFWFHMAGSVMDMTAPEISVSRVGTESDSHYIGYRPGYPVWIVSFIF